MPELTAEAAEAVIRDVREGVPMQTALLANGLRPKAIEEVAAVAAGRRPAPGHEPSPELLRSVVELLERVEVEMARREARMVKEIRTAGQTVSRSGVAEWRATAFLLSHAPETRRTYHEFREQAIDVRSADVLAEEHRIAGQLSDQELLELAPAEWRELVEIPSSQEPNSQP